ncbi:hypothetical protein D9M71_813410 [compost metagenome]
MAVGLHQALGAKVAASGQQAVGIAQGFIQRREGQGVAAQPGQHRRSMAQEGRAPSIAPFRSLRNLHGPLLSHLHKNTA